MVIKKMVNKVGIISLHEYISLFGINMCCIILFTSLLSFYLPLSLFSSLFFSCLPNNRLLYSLISSLFFSSLHIPFILFYQSVIISSLSSLLFSFFLSSPFLNHPYSLSYSHFIILFPFFSHSFFSFHSYFSFYCLAFCLD